MNFQETLQDFKTKVDIEIKSYFDKVIDESKKKDRIITDSLRYVKKMALAGGKRIRPALMYYGYIGCGGRDKKRIIETAVSIELIHIFLLIHDDIIDKDNKRHNIDTVHYRYKKLGKRFFPGSDSEHFGASMAIIIGDMIGALGNQIIFNSGFNAKLIMKALSKVQGIIAMTGIGESKDVYIEYKKKATEKEVIEMYEYKTAKYTIEGPLHLGAILGGADEKIISALSRYAIPVGIAFQIQDDTLGIFGNEYKLGKKVGSDISEGKQTILVVNAMENGTKEQRTMLRNILGKKDLSLGEINLFRNIIRETGALDYAQRLSRDYVAKGIKALENMTLGKESKDFLLGMANYIIEREV